MYSIVGKGIKSIRNIGSKSNDIVIVQYKDRRRFILTVYGDIHYLIQMDFYGIKGYKQIIVEDSEYFYSEMLRYFLTMVETEKEPFPSEETLEIIKVFVLGKRSREKGKEIYL